MAITTNSSISVNPRFRAENSFSVISFDALTQGLEQIYCKLS
jgi:hypothetical protein